MTHLASEVIARLRGRTLATAESCTGGMIGQLLHAERNLDREGLIQRALEGVEKIGVKYYDEAGN
jgi:hypothetical protein